MPPSEFVEELQFVPMHLSCAQMNPRFSQHLYKPLIVSKKASILLGFIVCKLIITLVFIFPEHCVSMKRYRKERDSSMLINLNVIVIIVNYKCVLMIFGTYKSLFNLFKLKKENDSPDSQFTLTY